MKLLLKYSLAIIVIVSLSIAPLAEAKKKKKTPKPRPTTYQGTGVLTSVNPTDEGGVFVITLDKKSLNRTFKRLLKGQTELELSVSDQTVFSLDGDPETLLEDFCPGDRVEFKVKAPNRLKHTDQFSSLKVNSFIGTSGSEDCIDTSES